MREKRNIPRWTSILMIAVAAVPSLVFLVQFFFRAKFPAHLEIMEGQTLFNAWRLAQGGQLYVEPSLQAVSPPYFPLYFHVVAILIKLFGPQWWTGRLVSYLSAVGMGALYYFVGRREGRSRAWGIVAAGLFFGSYGITGAYLDLFRVDSLPLFLGFAAFIVAAYRPTWSGVAFASLLVFLSVMGKQSQLYLIPVVALAFLRDDFPRGLLKAGAALMLSALLCAAGMYLYNWYSAGWMWKYCIEMVGYHRVIPARYPLYAIWLLKHFPIPLAVIIFYAVRLLVRKKFRIFFTEPWFYFAGASCISSILIWRFDGAYWNSLIPAAMGLLGAFAAFWPRLAAAYLPRLPEQTEKFAAPFAFLAIAGMLALQGFPMALKYPIWKQVPSKEMWKSARALNNYIADYPGVVYLPFYSLPDNPNWNLPHNVGMRDLALSRWGHSYYRKLMRQMDETQIDAAIVPRGRAVPPQMSRIAQKCPKKLLPRKLRADPGPLTKWPKYIYTCSPPE